MKSITFVSYIKCCENYVLLSKARIGFLYYKSALNDFEAKYRLEFGRKSTKLKCPCVTSQLTNQLKHFHINTQTKQLATKVKYTCLLKAPTPFGCPNTFIIRNNFFSPLPLDGRNFLRGGSMDLFWNDPINTNCTIVKQKP